MYKFRGLVIPGTGSQISWGAAPPKSIRTHHWGTKGETEIRSYQNGRVLRANIWLHKRDWTSSAKVYTFLSQLDRQLNQHGTLHEIDRNQVIVRTFRECTFVLREAEALREGAAAIPIPDDAGCLEPEADETIYWLPVNLEWYQLRST